MCDDRLPLAPALPHGLTLPQGRTLVMGILNVTPDSFSDGGRWDRVDAALAHAEEMIAQGADLIDVGGESTRPHSERITAQTEWKRIGTVVSELVGAGYVVSVDTLHEATARRSAEAGVAIINDVSGGCFCPSMNEAVAQSECAYIVQHWRGLPGTPEEDCHYDDVVAEVVAETRRQIDAAVAAGVNPERIIFDPGLGFSKGPEDCWELVDSMRQLHELGYPVLIGASRKRFIATVVDKDRDTVTCDITRKAVDASIWAVRVHDVAPNAQLVRAGQSGVEGGTLR